MKKNGKTLVFANPPTVLASAAIAGKKEGEGPLGDFFDEIVANAYFGEKTWERAESRFQRTAIEKALQKANLKNGDIDFLLAGDLLNQCTASTFAAAENGIPFIGLFGACSTMAEGLALGSILLDGGYAKKVLCAASSHFCSAERQFRLPLGYGGQRSPTAQWTATAAGAFVLGSGASSMKKRIVIRHALIGTPVDLGIKDASNMGAAMAPSAYLTLKQFFADTQTVADDYDLIATGDLGEVGHSLVQELFARDGVKLGSVYNDCGLMLFYKDKQDVHAGGSGCGCSAAVSAGYIMDGLQKGSLQKVILAGTGALMSPTSAMQGQNIVGVTHLVSFEVMV